jgi:hypothetical protein
MRRRSRPIARFSSAIAAWEKLLAATPDYPNAANVRSLTV